MASLTSILPSLAPQLGMTTAALYERQRLLVKFGLLQKPVGRGRGSGAIASPDTIAWILLSTLAADNLSDVEPAVKALTSAMVSGREHGPFRSGCSLHEAMTTILAQPQIATKISFVAVHRNIPSGQIGWMTGLKPNIENRLIVFWPKREPAETSLSVRADLAGDFLIRISTALHSGEWK